jgi:hypothetical protein
MNLVELEKFFYDSVRADAPPRAIDEIFVGSAELGAVRRMSIYHSAYWTRQIRTLSETFPHTSRALGDERFRRIAGTYLAQCPSEKPAIEFVGERFPAFLREMREIPAVVPEVARLEWSRTEALLAPDPETLVRREDLAGIELWRFRAVLAAHVRVLRLPRGALRYAKHEADANVDLTHDETVCTVVYRRSHKVWHTPFEEPEGRAIELAAKHGAFAEVCAAFGEGSSVAEIAGRIGTWIDKGWIERLEEGAVDAA